jgi:hypothetical protein
MHLTSAVFRRKLDRWDEQAQCSGRSTRSHITSPWVLFPSHVGMDDRGLLWFRRSLAPWTYPWGRMPSSDSPDPGGRLAPFSLHWLSSSAVG